MSNDLWVEKYRPNTLDECILPDHLINQFKSLLRENLIPNMILCGHSGIGKTSVAVALLKEYGGDYIKINSSLERGIDTIKDRVMQFASTTSFADKKKYIIFDEADGMTSSAQESLKAFIEEFTDNCGYIFTCNNYSKINDAIKSRCLTINFNITKEEMPILAKAFLSRLEFIFSENNITYDVKSVAFIIKKYYPDWRNILINLQNYYLIHGEINNGLLGNKDVESYTDLIILIKNKKWNDIRKWVGENSHICNNFAEFGKLLIKQIEPLVNINALPVLIIRLNEYDFQHQFVSDKEINVVAFLTKVMSECTFK